MPPIFVVTGAPAVGKSTFCNALLKRFPFGLHIPVDDLREWVVAGIAHPVGWTDETTRQFGLAEQGAADLAIRYQDAGFAIAIDHCQGPPTLDALIADRFAGREVYRIALTCDLATNHARNASRTNKTFDFSVLQASIDALNPLYRSHPLAEAGWIVVDNEADGIHHAVNMVLRQVQNG